MSEISLVPDPISHTPRDGRVRPEMTVSGCVDQEEILTAAKAVCTGCLFHANSALGGPCEGFSQVSYNYSLNRRLKRVAVQSTGMKVEGSSFADWVKSVPKKKRRELRKVCATKAVITVKA